MSLSPNLLRDEFLRALDAYIDEKIWCAERNGNTQGDLHRRRTELERTLDAMLEDVPPHNHDGNP
jgi:hypothetical protein